jgi:hypothetical protein
MMIMVMIVIMMMVVMIVVVMMVVMIMIVMMMVIVVIVVMMQVWGHDTRQADRIMWMVVAVTAAIVCRGRSRGERHSAETGQGGRSKGDYNFTGHCVSSEQQDCLTQRMQALTPRFRLLMWHHVVHVVHVLWHHVFVATVVRHRVLFANFAATV